MELNKHQLKVGEYEQAKKRKKIKDSYAWA